MSFADPEASKTVREHTPRPWFVQDNSSPNGVHVYSPGAGVIVCRLTAKADKSIDQKWADARLIAAAPELLHSLRWLMAMLECGTLVRNIERDAERDFSIRMAGFVANLKVAQDAIDKAEGHL